MAITEVAHNEEEFIFDKRMTCPVCDKPFKTKVLKSNKARRIGSDKDLRPRYAHIDTMKYGVCSCPNCGYSALHKTFPNLVSRQMASIREQVCAHFQPEDRSGWGSYTYDQAIRLHELALECADAKLAKDGEKAYLHMLLAWLYREKAALADEAADGVVGESAGGQEQERDRSLSDEHYLLAYEGFEQAMMNEMFPIMGLDQPTLEYIMAYMALYFGKIEISAKLIGSVLTTTGASRHVKDMALDLKTDIIELLKQRKKAQG